MNIELLKPGESLVERVGEALLSTGDPAGQIVVFPGKRPAHFLRKFLAEKKGSALKAPLIISMDGFMDLAAADLGFDAPSASQLDLVQLLHGRLKAGLGGLLSRAPGELSLDSVLPWALKIIGDFEELKIELKTVSDLASYDSILPEDLRSGPFIKKLENFSRLYGEFYAAAEKEGLMTRSMKYAAAAENSGKLCSGKYGHVIFAGLFALTAAEKAVVKELAGRGARLFLEPGPGLKEQFSFLGQGGIQENRSTGAQEHRSTGAQEGKGETKLFFYKAPDAHGEVFKLAQVLGSFSTPPRPYASTPHSSVIVLPDAGILFPLLENVLPDAGEYNISMGYPLAATPVYSLIEALADLLDRRSKAGYFTPDYLRFLFHPYIKNIYFGGERAGARPGKNRSSEPGRVILQIVEEALSARPGKYVKPEELVKDAALLESAAAKLKDYGLGDISPAAVGEHLTLLRRTLITPFEELKNIADFSDKLLAFISFLSSDSTAPFHPYWARFAERLMESASELKSSRLARERFGTTGGYFRFFRGIIRSASYPFPGTPLKGLQVLGFLETRGLKFDRVYFMDANSDILPASRKEDTVLSHFVREGLGLPTYKTREAVARYHFNTLLSGAGEAHIFYRDSADKERSPLVEKLIWELERRGGRADENDVHFRIKFAQAEPSPVVKTPGLIAALKAREFSPSAIDAYLDCGLRFYYRYALRLKEKDEISGEMEQRDIGLIVHEVLENFFRSRSGRPLAIKEEDYALMREEAGRVFAGHMGGGEAGFEYLIKRQGEKRLEETLDYHRDNLAGATVLGCETELRASLSTRYGSVKLKGRADRVDLRGGCVHILDYKTGSAARAPNWQKFDLGLREDWPRTLRSVQLPFYILAYLEENGGSDIRNMDASLMLLGGESIAEESLFRERYKKVPEKAALFGPFKQAICSLVEEILDPELPFCPAADEGSCSACPFAVMCGRQWV